MARRIWQEATGTRRAFLWLLVFCGFFSAGAAPVYALEAGTRAFGMGGAFTGVADDATAAFWNPAGITQIKYVGLLSSLGIGVPDMEEWTRSLNLSEQRVFEALPRIDAGAEAVYGKSVATARYAFSHGVYMIGTHTVRDYSVNLHEGTFGFASLTLAYPVGEFLPGQLSSGSLKGLSLGANLKLIGASRYDFSRSMVQTQDASTNTVSVDDFQTTATSGGGGFGVDLGLLVPVNEKLSWGATVRDLYTKIDWTKGGTTEVSHYVLNSDGSITVTSNSVSDFASSRETEIQKPSFRTGVAFRPWKSMILAADFEGESVYSHSAAWHFGVEQKVLFDIIALRVGEVIQPGGILAMQTVGVGLKLGPFLADLAAASSDHFVNSINAQGSLGFQF